APGKEVASSKIAYDTVLLDRALHAPIHVGWQYRKIGRAKSSALNSPTVAVTGFFLLVTTSERIYFSLETSNFALMIGLDRISSYSFRTGPLPAINSLDSAGL